MKLSLFCDGIKVTDIEAMELHAPPRLRPFKPTISTRRKLRVRRAKRYLKQRLMKFKGRTLSPELQQEIYEELQRHSHKVMLLVHG